MDHSPCPIVLVHQLSRVRMYVHMHVCCVCMYVMYACTHVCAYACMSCVHVCHVCVYACRCICMYVMCRHEVLRVLGGQEGFGLRKR